MQCAICSKSSPLTQKEKHNKYTLWQCNYCLGQFWYPMKNPGAEWYEKDERYSFRNRNPVKKPEVNHREFLRDNPVSGGKLLDVGMGTGHFLAGAVAKGYDGYGIDFDRDGINTAKTVFSLKNVEVGDIDFTINRYGKQFFDAVTLFEVLEHIENPGEFVGKIKQLLKAGGYLGLSVPYRGSWDVFKKYDKPPRHLTRWNREAMKNFLESHGFKVVRMKVIPVPFSYLIAKFHFWFMGVFSFGLVGKAASSAALAKTAAGKSEINWKIKLLHALAYAKDYVLFSIPAAILYLSLLMTGRAGLSLYTLAFLNEHTV